MSNQIDQYLRQLIANDGSDLHLIAGQPPRTRVYGEITAMEKDILEPDFARDMFLEIMDDKARHEFDKFDATDFAYNIEGLARFRVNVMRHLGGMGAVLRAIPSNAKTLLELNMPPSVNRLSTEPQGLILVTGKTGSGKSTTLAAMIDAINDRLHGHILTIEDPVEFVHQRKKCLISQREIGQHTGSFREALHSALREDPDVILVGEMRDLETISIAVTAAEMGILVMGTLHTNGAAQTVDRIVNVFPSDKQSHVRTMLSTSLRGVISQQLVPRKDGNGLTAILEVLINNSATANLIRQGKLDQLETVMQSGRRSGMCTMDSSLKEAMDKAKISGQSAYEFANDKSKFEAVKSQT
ncbi:MAG: type IV pilus twitching motility protein PilT [Gammaproteobacteria bacterium]|nr:type IV pilus twitching motility protein PilT [Gammaproteobacteria bacterium]